jgi:hypothetical protein
MLRAGEVLDATGDNRDWRTLADFALSSEPGSERLAMQEVARAFIATGLAHLAARRSTASPSIYILKLKGADVTL